MQSSCSEAFNYAVQVDKHLLFATHVISLVQWPSASLVYEYMLWIDIPEKQMPVGLLSTNMPLITLETRTAYCAACILVLDGYKAIPYSFSVYI